MRIGLIISNNLWFCPYVNIYTSFFKKTNNIQYEIISWNRDGSETEINQFNKRSNGRASLYDYLSFTHHVISIVRKKKFDKLIVLCPVMSILLCSFLRVCYNKKYIIDYRDLSIDQTFIGKYLFKYALNHCEYVVISSPGFKRFLPNDIEYILSHNFDVELAKTVLKNSHPPKEPHGDIDVLTIGGIRDFESNVQILHSLGNKKSFSMRFVGYGIASEMLKQESIKCYYNNVEFVGYYKKQDESSYIKDATFMNIFYPRKVSHDSAISNRFYHSLIYRIPMITTEDTIQGDFTEQYGLGVALNNCSELEKKLKAYLISDAYSNFTKNANFLLERFINDYDRFQMMLRAFVTK